MLLLNWMQMMRNMHFWIKFFVVGKCYEKGRYYINYRGNIICVFKKPEKKFAESFNNLFFS